MQRSSVGSKTRLLQKWRDRLIANTPAIVNICGEFCERAYSSLWCTNENDISCSILLIVKSTTETKISMY